ncbi:unnamed protein product [Rotaria sp. Silwood1]|nr:unnamed protein product [Rotaria sp. Silwood1]
MKSCLAEGYPFAFGILTYKSFHDAAKNGGRVPMPKLPYESQNASHGAHAMLAVGYSDLSQCFIVRNSWGNNWGEKGYCYIPYKYMANQQLCLDAHTVKIVTEASRHRIQPNTTIHNPYDWNVDKDKAYYIPPDYAFDSFDHTFFWKSHETFNYMDSIWQQGYVVPFESNASTKEIDNDQPSILWIDRKSSDNSKIEERLKHKQNVTIDYCETFSQGKNHLLTHRDKIKLSSRFQIISRGYYTDEDKNPLNLLQLLNDLQLSHVPVLVFTGNKINAENKLQNQALSMNIYDWQERLFITDKSEELVKKIKDNISKSK